MLLQVIGTGFPRRPQPYIVTVAIIRAPFAPVTSVAVQLTLVLAPPAPPGNLRIIARLFRGLGSVFGSRGQRIRITACADVRCQRVTGVTTVTLAH